MDTNRVWIKGAALTYAVFPQWPSFCGVATCCGALGSILQKPVTQQELQRRYQVGLYTKLHASAVCDPNTFAKRQRSGKGFSNWDAIRLCNAVLLDEGREPAATVFCGQDFVRESAQPECRRELLDWLRHDSCQALIHLQNHYVLFAGAHESSVDGSLSLLVADSSKRSGPLRSLALAELSSLANADERYGFVLISDRDIPRTLFRTWTSAMMPPEVSERRRFARIDKS
ncbi:MAG: hypothetical protein V7641_3316 [Blastocatellia bacterium]